MITRNLMVKVLNPANYLEDLKYSLTLLNRIEKRLCISPLFLRHINPFLFASGLQRRHKTGANVGDASIVQPAKQQ